MNNTQLISGILQKAGMYVQVWEKVSSWESACVCVQEREREREGLCVSDCEHVREKGRLDIIWDILSISILNMQATHPSCDHVNIVICVIVSLKDHKFIPYLVILCMLN